MMGNVWLAGNGPVASIAAARERAGAAAAAAGLHPGEVIWFDNGFYVELKDAAGNPATEVIVDPVSGTVFTEPGPAMMWNTRYGMHRAINAPTTSPTDQCAAGAADRQRLAGRQPAWAVRPAARPATPATTHRRRPRATERSTGCSRSTPPPARSGTTPGTAGSSPRKTRDLVPSSIAHPRLRVGRGCGRWSSTTNRAWCGPSPAICSTRGTRWTLPPMGRRRWRRRATPHPTSWYWI